MKYLNKYIKFEENVHIRRITDSERNNYIISTCDKYHIRNYTINNDWTIDVDGDVYLCGQHLWELPLNFNRVSGYFYCGQNNLESFEGCPKYIGRYFNCCDNAITSLEGCPEHIGWNFYCDNNPIYSIAQYFIYRKDKNINTLIELFNYYDIVQDRNVIYDRLKFFYEGIDIKLTDGILNNIEKNGYEIIR